MDSEINKKKKEKKTQALVPATKKDLNVNAFLFLVATGHFWIRDEKVEREREREREIGQWKSQRCEMALRYCLFGFFYFYFFWMYLCVSFSHCLCFTCSLKYLGIERAWQLLRFEFSWAALSLFLFGEYRRLYVHDCGSGRSRF